MISRWLCTGFVLCLFFKASCLSFESCFSNEDKFLDVLFMVGMNTYTASIHLTYICFLSTISIIATGQAYWRCFLLLSFFTPSNEITQEDTNIYLSDCLQTLVNLVHHLLITCYLLVGDFITQALEKYWRILAVISSTELELVTLQTSKVTMWKWPISSQSKYQRFFATFTGQ